MIVLVPNLPEDHATGAVLQHAGDHDVGVRPDQLAGSFADDHRAVIQVSNPLTRRFPFLDDFDLHPFAGQIARFERIRHVVEIHHIHALNTGDFIEIKVIGNDSPAELHGDFNQSLVDGEVFHAIFIACLVHAHIDVLIGLQFGENIQTAASPIAAEFLFAVGDILQLFEHERRHDQFRIEHIGLDHVGDSSVDDGAGIQNVRAAALDFLRKLHVGDDEAKVIFSVQQPGDT